MVLSMKKIEQYISGKPVALLTEHILKGHLKKQVNYKYYPETTDEFIKYIIIELKNGNTDLNCIDTSKITEMRYLFDPEDGIRLTDEQQKTLDISRWDMSNVTDTYCMFYKCASFNCDLSKWNVSKVTNMSRMFYRCKQFNSDLSKWKVSNVTNMGHMFEECEQFNSNLSKWNVSKVENMRDMFRYCYKFNSDLSSWDVSNVTDMTFMFENSGLDGNEPKWYKK